MTNVLAFPAGREFGIPSPVNSLEGYISAVNRFPLLTPEEETRLGRRLKFEGDLEAAKLLILSHLRVVVALSRGYLGYGLPHADLIQEGNIGLMKAVRRFDPERGVRLVSFAVHWIRAEIHEFILRNWRLVKIATTKAQRKLFFNLRSLKHSLGRMGVEEASAMARQLGVKEEEVREMETRFSGGDVALEAPIESEEETLSPIAYLTNPDDEPSRILEQEEESRLDGEGLQRALTDLDQRSRRIIEARWLREKDSATLHQLADEFGVSAERIRQIEAKALHKMKAALTA
jgi:RNA polymerase sigma-32 factor